jgi:hypothetical protein
MVTIAAIMGIETVCSIRDRKMAASMSIPSLQCMVRHAGSLYPWAKVHAAVRMGAARMIGQAQLVLRSPCLTRINTPVPVSLGIFGSRPTSSHCVQMTSAHVLGAAHTGAARGSVLGRTVGTAFVGRGGKGMVVEQLPMAAAAQVQASWIAMFAAVAEQTTRISTRLQSLANAYNLIERPKIAVNNTRRQRVIFHAGKSLQTHFAAAKDRVTIRTPQKFAHATRIFMVHAANMQGHHKVRASESIAASMEFA